MTLASTLTIDKTEVLEDGTIQVRQAEIITKDGNEIARNFTRWVRHPGDANAHSDPAPVPAIATAVWTEAVIAAYEAAVAAQKEVGV